MDKHLETLLIVAGVAAVGYYAYKHYTTPAPVTTTAQPRNPSQTPAAGTTGNQIQGVASGIENLYGEVSSLFN